MFGKLTTEEIDQLLNKQLIGRIGCHANHQTYVVPVSYVYNDDSIYVHTYRGRKIDMMEENPNVCFQVDDTRDIANWQSVICWGTFEELTEESAKRDALKKLQGRLLPLVSSETMHISREWPFSANHEEKLEGIYFKIKVTEKTGRFEKISSGDFFAT